MNSTIVSKNGVSITDEELKKCIKEIFNALDKSLQEIQKQYDIIAYILDEAKEELRNFKVSISSLNKRGKQWKNKKHFV